MKNPRLGSTTVIVAALMWSRVLTAGIGDVDSEYGFRGVLTNSGYLNTMTATPDGRVVTAAIDDLRLYIYMSDATGHPDPGFSPQGVHSDLLAPDIYYDDAVGTAAAVSPEGPMYFAHAGGNDPRAILLRTTAVGALDANFGDSGVVTFSPPAAFSGAVARILSIAPLANGQSAVLVGYFPSIYECSSDMRIFRLSSDGLIESEYDHAALLAATGACAEYGGVTLAALVNGYVSVLAGNAPTVFDPSGKVVTLDLHRAGIAGTAFSLAPDPEGAYVYVAGPDSFQAGSCAVSRLTPDMSHGYMDGDGDDSLQVDFSSDPNARAGIRSCKILVGAQTGSVYVLAEMAGVDGKSVMAITRVLMRGHYYPAQDMRFGKDSIAVLGANASFTLFGEQADGSLLLSHGSFAGGPAQGGDAVIKLLGTDLPSPGITLLEAPSYAIDVSLGHAANINVRRALGSQGATTATYVVIPQHDGTPVNYSQVKELAVSWGNGEQGVKSIEAISEKDAIGHYDVYATSLLPTAVFLFTQGAFSVEAPGPQGASSPPGNTLVGSGASGESGGGSIGGVALLMLACLLWSSAGRVRYSRSRSR